MKNKFSVSVCLAFTVILFLCCEPYRDTYGTYIAALKADINKTTESIYLGDTLKFTLQWPDVLNSKTLNGETRTDNVNSLQVAWFVYRIFRVDTINRTVYTKVGDSTKVTFFLSEGYENNPCQPCYGGSAYLQRNSKPFRSVLNLIPQVKGLFYVEIAPQAGAFKVNNNFDGLFTVDFNVNDKHANIIAPFLTSWEQVVAERGNQGFGIYCFRVN